MRNRGEKEGVGMERGGRREGGEKIEADGGRGEGGKDKKSHTEN